MLIPEGALLFAMHPAIVDSALGKTSSEDSQNERATLAANEPLDVRSVRSLLVARPGAPSSFLLLVAMHFAPSSVLLLVVRPGAPSSVLAPRYIELVVCGS